MTGISRYEVSLGNPSVIEFNFILALIYLLSSSVLINEFLGIASLSMVDMLSFNLCIKYTLSRIGFFN